MKKISKHIAYLKSKPHHVRKRIAFGTAATITTLIGVLWFGASFSSGSYAITGSNFAQSTGSSTVAPVVHSAENTNKLAGVAAAFYSSEQTKPAHIEIIDTATTSTLSQKNTDRTIIPF